MFEDSKSGKIRFVLLETSHPGNIGAAARAIKTMGFDQLYLVNPLNFPNCEATARASGADDVLAKARNCTDLDSALQGCNRVIGTSTRSRTMSWPVISARECANQVADEAGSGNIAFVFGRERDGLSNQELEYCHFLVRIPANPEYSSLNLASAVQILAYELRLAFQNLEGRKSTKPAPEHIGAAAENMSRFYQHMQKVLEDADFLDPQNPRQLMRRLKRLFNRANPDETELNILRGILTAVSKSKMDT